MKTTHLWSVLALLVASPVAAQTVNCDNGGNLQTAISAAPVGGTVKISGRCDNGPFYVYKDLTLVGNGKSAATLAAPDGDRVLYVSGAKVSIQNLRVDATGSVFGIIVEERGKAAIDNVVVEGASGPGVFVYLTSYASITNTLTRNNLIGISVESSSSAWIVDSQTVANTVYGIQARKASSLDIINTSARNNSAGIVVDEASAAEFSNVTVTSNSGPGVWVPHNAIARFTGTVSTIQANGVDIRCDRGATALFDTAQSSTTKSTAFDATCIVENSPFAP
jgi:nitrous oxidase accessory protein NosD